MVNEDDSVSRDRARVVTIVKAKHDAIDLAKKEERLAKMKPKVKEIPLMKSNKPSIVDDIVIENKPVKEILSLF